MFAWEVSDQEFGSMIVFASNEADAAHVGARELQSDEEFIQVERSPHWDEYAEQGYVPIETRYEHYWVFGCWECEQDVSIADDEDEDGNPIHPIFEAKRVFCCSQCQTTFYADAQKIKKDKETAQEELLQKFPGIRVVGSFGGGHYPVGIDFRFPGGRSSARWCSDNSDIVILSESDLDAWNDFAKGDLLQVQ